MAPQVHLPGPTSVKLVVPSRVGGSSGFGDIVRAADNMDALATMGCWPSNISVRAPSTYFAQNSLNIRICAESMAVASQSAAVHCQRRKQ